MKGLGISEIGFKDSNFKIKINSFSFKKEDLSRVKIFETKMRHSVDIITIDQNTPSGHNNFWFKSQFSKKDTEIV